MRDVATGLFGAFQRRDHETMGSYYGLSSQFTDPVFIDLRGRRIRAMWHMLCVRGSDLEVSFESPEIDSEGQVTVDWEARYSFGPAERKVHNRVHTRLEIIDGTILDHVDGFDLWRWTRMALGVPGLLTGWSPYTRNRVRKMAERSLERFIEVHPEYAERPDG